MSSLLSALLSPFRRTKYDRPLRARGEHRPVVSCLREFGRSAYAAALSAAVRDYAEGAAPIPELERRHRLTKNALRHALERGHPAVRDRPASDRLSRAASEYARFGGRPDKIALRWGVPEADVLRRGEALARKFPSRRADSGPRAPGR